MASEIITMPITPAAQVAVADAPSIALKRGFMGVCQQLEAASVNYAKAMLAVGAYAAKYAAVRHGELLKVGSENWQNNMATAFAELRDYAQTQGWARAIRCSEDVKVWLVSQLDERLEGLPRYVYKALAPVVALGVTFDPRVSPEYEPTLRFAPVKGAHDGTDKKGPIYWTAERLRPILDRICAAPLQLDDKGRPVYSEPPYVDGKPAPETVTSTWALRSPQSITAALDAVEASLRAPKTAAAVPTTTDTTDTTTTAGSAVVVNPDDVWAELQEVTAQLTPAQMMEALLMLCRSETVKGAQAAHVACTVIDTCAAEALAEELRHDATALARINAALALIKPTTTVHDAPSKPSKPSKKAK